MQSTTKSHDSILKKEAIGFSIIIVLSWVTEFLHIPYLLFSEPHEFNWHRAALRTLVILAIWFWVHVATKRLLKRLHYLEGYLRLCSWCRKVNHEGEWMTMEQFFNSRFATETSHSICPECALRIQQPLIPKPPAPDAN